jgi:hypothetical protein
VHDRFGRKQQDQQRRDRHRAQGQDRPIEHHADEHDRDHDERALGCDLRAGKDEIERGDDERGERSPFLDRRPVREPGDEREDGAHDADAMGISGVLCFPDSAMGSKGEAAQPWPPMRSC